MSARHLTQVERVLTGVGALSSFTLIDAMLSYKTGRPWRFALYASNLTDKTYITNCGSGSCYFGTQRQTLFTASYRW